jgi:hypothetical protein
LKGMISFQAVVPANTFIGDLMPIALHLVEDPFLTARKLLAELCIDVAAKVRCITSRHSIFDNALIYEVFLLI